MGPKTSRSSEENSWGHNDAIEGLWSLKFVVITSIEQMFYCPTSKRLATVRFCLSVSANVDNFSSFCNDKFRLVHTYVTMKKFKWPIQNSLELYRAEHVSRTSLHGSKLKTFAVQMSSENVHFTGHHFVFYIQSMIQKRLVIGTHIYVT
jgi:hypothetical protein